MKSNHPEWIRATWRTSAGQEFAIKSRRSFPFLPGLFFITLGVIVLLAPRLVIGAIAAVLFMLGIVCCYLAWKFVRFKRQLAIFTKDLGGRIQIHGVQVKSGGLDKDRDIDEEKIVYH